MSKFLNELKRRNVIKSTIAYLVVAWVLLQVFTVLLPILSAPDWILKGLTLLLAIGLPIWIIVSWIYDLTPQGIEKTSDVSKNDLSRHATNKRLNAFIIASLSIAVVVMGLKMSNVFGPSTDGKYSIAVMPFVNVSNDIEQEYFSDGISEEIINMLSQVPGLKVMARTSSFSFKGKNQDAKSIGEQLEVSHILEGSVRRSGNKLRITAQLINIFDGSQMFSEQFDREVADVFDIQDEISEEILDAIKIKLLGEEKENILKKYTNNTDAYEQYLKGRFHVNKMTPDGFIKAIEFFDKAIAIDESYAAAYSEKAFSYMNLRDFNWLPSEQTVSQAIEASEKAFNLDNQSAESHLAIGRIKLHWQWNVRDAMTAFKKAIDLNPNSPQAHVQLAFCLVQLDRFEEASKHADIAKNLDPLSILNLWYINAVYFSVKDLKTGLSIANNMIDLEPNNHLGHNWAALAYFINGQYNEALTESKLMAELGFEIDSLYIKGLISAREGDKTATIEIIEKFKQSSMFHEIGNLYAYLGDLDNAFLYYNLAVENRKGFIMWIKYNETPAEVLNDSRFLELKEKMGIIY
jgi:serine/threonine-protein kinase